MSLGQDDSSPSDQEKNLNAAPCSSSSTPSPSGGHGWMRGQVDGQKDKGELGFSAAGQAQSPLQRCGAITL